MCKVKQVPLSVRHQLDNGLLYQFIYMFQSRLETSIV